MKNIVAIKFKDPGYRSSNKLYHYYTDLKTIKVGDKVVVDSPSDGYVVVDVKEVNPVTDGSLLAHKFIVCKVDDTKYKKRQEDVIKAKQIEKQLDELAEQQKKRGKYDILADVPEAAELLKELKNLA